MKTGCSLCRNEHADRHSSVLDLLCKVLWGCRPCGSEGMGSLTDSRVLWSGASALTSDWHVLCMLRDGTNGYSVWKVVLASGKSDSGNEVALCVHVKEMAAK